MENTAKVQQEEAARQLAQLEAEKEALAASAQSAAPSAAKPAAKADDGWGDDFDDLLESEVQESGLGGEGGEKADAEVAELRQQVESEAAARAASDEKIAVLETQMKSVEEESLETLGLLEEETKLKEAEAAKRQELEQRVTQLEAEKEALAASAQSAAPSAAKPAAKADDGWGDDFDDLLESGLGGGGGEKADAEVAELRRQVESEAAARAALEQKVKELETAATAQSGAAAKPAAKADDGWGDDFDDLLDSEVQESGLGSAGGENADAEVAELRRQVESE